MSTPEKMKKYFLLLIICGILAACQTSKKLPVSEIPQTMLPLFDKCMKDDGGGDIVYNVNEKKITGISLDWIQNSKAFVGELSDPVGGTFVRWDMNKPDNKIDLAGYAAPKNGVLTIDQDGFLNFDDYFVGIRPDELPCFLSFKVPFQWTNYLIDKKTFRSKSSGKIGKQELEFNDDKRVMWVSYYPQIGKTCSKVKWSNFWGLKSTVWNICYYTRKEPWKAVFEFSPSDYIEMTAERDGY